MARNGLKLDQKIHQGDRQIVGRTGQFIFHIQNIGTEISPTDKVAILKRSQACCQSFFGSRRDFTLQLTESDWALNQFAKDVDRPLSLQDFPH